MVDSFDLSTQEAEAGESLPVRGQPGLQNKFQDSQGYTEKPCLKKTNKKPTALWKLTVYQNPNNGGV